MKRLAFALVGAAALTSSAASSQVIHANKAVQRRQMIVRADDVGATNVYNMGVFDAIDNGVVTWADVMLDCPGTTDALRRLKARPWITVGWHAHMWGSPVLPAKQVPSLVVPAGQEFAGRFRTDLQTANDVVYEEVLAELRAEMKLSIRYLGHAPTYGAVDSLLGPVDTKLPFNRAKQAVIDEFGLIDGNWFNAMGKKPADAKWSARKIWYTDNLVGVKDIFQTDSIVDWEKNYSPINYYLEDRGKQIELMNEGWTPVRAWHPGYLDLWTYRYMERGDRTYSRRFTIARLLDLEGLTSPKMKSWLIQNRISLVSPQDAMFGTSKYQQHLKAIASPLYVAPT